MAIVLAPKLPRQLRTMFRDYSDSWSTNTGKARKRDRRRAAAYFFATPTVVSLVFLFWRVELVTVTPFLTGLSVFTGLLFGLLILVFNTAITLRKDGASIKNAHGLEDAVSDLRATITYAIAVAIGLVLLLSVASVTVAPDSKGLPGLMAWGWTPVLVWFAVHLLLNVAKILERIRTAFRYILQ